MVPEQGALEPWALAAAEVTDVLATARSLAEVAPALLAGVGDRLGCTAAALWARAPRGDALECLRAWQREGDGPSSVGSPSARVATDRLAGVLGRAWAQRRPVWSHDLPASGAAHAAPGHLAIPILYGEVRYGLLELLRRDPAPPREPERVVASTLGKQLGQFVVHEESYREATRSRRDFQDVFDNAPVGMHLMDRDGRVLRSNRVESEMLGYSKDELKGMLWRDLHAEPLAADELMSKLVSAGDATVRREARLRGKDGSVKWVRIDANVMRDDGEFVHVRTFLRDVTTGKDAEHALRASEERYRRLVEGAREYALHALDPEGRVTGWNSGAQRLYGYDEQDVLGKDFALSFRPEDRADEVPARMLRLAADEGEFRHEGWRVRKDGSRFWAEVVYTALRDPDGRLAGISQLTRDVTERRWLEALRRRSADLESANRAVLEAGRRNAELLRSVAAAVDGPTGEIEAAARRLREAGRGGPELDTLAAGVAGLRRALEDLEQLASAAPAGVGDEPIAVDLLRLATETRDLLREAAAERRIRVDVDVDPALPGVVADPVRLRQVLYNFLSNAIKFSRERGRAALRVLPEGESLFRVEVEDSGIGIAPEDQARVFEGRHGGEDGAPASGVGLPATKRIVEEQGGRVGVQSTLGRGSVFFAVLPLRPTPLMRDDRGDAGTAATETRRALVVSEEPATLAGVSWTLGHAGFATLSARQAEEAVDVLRDQRFDALAVDLLLGGLGAVDLVATVRASGASRDVPWILAALGTEAGAACLAVADLLPRPAPADRLFAALERAGVPSGRRSPILVVDGEVRLLDAAARTLEILGYEAKAEPEGDAALRACAETPPAAVLLSPFLHGMDAFVFLRHLRQTPALGTVPVFLLVPRQLDETQLARLREAAATAASDRGWARSL